MKTGKTGRAAVSLPVHALTLEEWRRREEKLDSGEGGRRPTLELRRMKQS